MDGSAINPESVTIPHWTIKRDSRSWCKFCRSIVVCITTETSQMAFRSCRLLEYRLLTRPNVHKANPGRHRGLPLASILETC